jgi:hypothetical protein
MINRTEKSYGNVIVVQRSDYKWGVIDKQGNEIVPFGRYLWIDKFDQGLARVKSGCYNGDKWGIINTKGEVVLPIEYDSIWNFAGKNRNSTRTIKNGINEDIYLHDLNPDLPQKGSSSEQKAYALYDNHRKLYGEYAGSYAQEVMGYSDDIIDDAFDGDPEAYWNID